MRRQVEADDEHITVREVVIDVNQFGECLELILSIDVLIQEECLPVVTVCFQEIF